MDKFVDFLPFLSLLVALLAVIVGPIVSWKVAKLQSENAARLASNQLIAPIRQAWIDKLRALLGEYSAICFSYYIYGVYIHDLSFDSEGDHEEIEQQVEQRLTILKFEIELLLNPHESEHELLLENMSSCFRGLFRGSSEEHRVNFPDHHVSLSAQCKKVLKLEWNRVKGEL